MTGAISPRDWDTLNAYIDRQLSEKERATFEARLQSEPELYQAVRDIWQVKALIRSAPRHRAPRNFTLSPGRAGVRLRSPLYPTFRLASVVASLLFVFVLIGDLLTGVTTGVPVVARLGSAPEAILAEQVQAPAADAALIQEQAVEQPAALAQPFNAQPPLPAAELAAPMPTEILGIGGGPTAKAMPAPTSAPTATVPVPTALPPPAPIEEQSADVEPLRTQPPVDDSLYSLPYIPSWVVWGLEGALLMVALLAAFVALLVRRLR